MLCLAWRAESPGFSRGDRGERGEWWGVTSTCEVDKCILTREDSRESSGRSPSVNVRRPGLPLVCVVRNHA